jgi:hypothetical protein
MTTDTPAGEQTFEQKVNAIVSKASLSDDGTLVLPEDMQLDEPTRFAVTLEKRRRDTQSAYSQTQARVKTLEAENKHLADAWKADAGTKLTKEQRDDLEELKHSDPDAWRTRLNEIEQENANSFTTRKTEISQKASQETELEQRQRLLEEFTTANEGLVLNDQVIEDEIPPKFIKQLEKGEVDFETFLNNCKNFLTAGKVLAQPDNDVDDVSLGKMPGGSRPSASAVDGAVKDSYKTEVY